MSKSTFTLYECLFEIVYCRSDLFPGVAIADIFKFRVLSAESTHIHTTQCIVSIIGNRMAKGSPPVKKSVCTVPPEDDGEVLQGGSVER